MEKGKDEGSAEVSEWTPLGLEGVTYVEDDGYADDESGYSGDDDGDGFGDHNHSGSSLWAEDGSDIVWYEVIDAESGFPYWLHAVRVIIACLHGARDSIRVSLLAHRCVAVGASVVARPDRSCEWYVSLIGYKGKQWLIPTFRFTPLQVIATS